MPPLGWDVDPKVRGAGGTTPNPILSSWRQTLNYLYPLSSNTSAEHATRLPGIHLSISNRGLLLAVICSISVVCVMQSFGFLAAGRLDSLLLIVIAALTY